MKFYFTFTKENLIPAFKQKREALRACSMSAISQLPSVQNNLYTIVAHFKVAYSDPFQSMLISSYSINKLVIDNLLIKTNHRLYNLNF